MQCINLSVIFYAMPVIFLIFACFRSWLDYKQAQAIEDIFTGYDKHLESISSELDGINHSIKMLKFVKKPNKEA